MHCCISILLFTPVQIAENDLIWPFRVFYYIMPFSYYLHAQMYNVLIDSTWSPCDTPETSPVCVSPPTGPNVLQGIGLSYPLIDVKDTYWEDLGIIVAIAIVYKLLYIAGVYLKSSRSAKVHGNEKAVRAAGVTTSDRIPESLPLPETAALERAQVMKEQIPVEEDEASC